MLMTLRRGFKEHGLRIILWFTIFAMGLGYAAQVLLDRHPGRKQSDIAVVNGKVMDSRMFMQRMSNEQERITLLRQQLGSQFEQYEHLLGAENIPQRVLETMIHEEIIAQAAQTSSLKPSSDYVMEKLHDPQFAINNLSHILPFYVLNPQQGTIDPQLVQQYLHKFGIQISQLEQTIEQIISSQLLFNLLSNTAFVSPAEIKARYIQTYVPRTYEILSFSLDNYRKAARTQTVSDAQLKAFIAQAIANDSQYIVPEQRSGAVWTFSVDSYGITPSEKAIEQYYAKHKFKQFVKQPAEVHVREITLPADFDTQKLETIRQTLTDKPDEFAQYAQQYSTADTASEGGLMEPFTRGTHDTVFERHAFGLDKKGDITLIESPQGTTILQLVDKKPTEFESLTRVRSDIVNEIAQERFSERFSIDMKQVLTQHQSNPDALAQFARQKGAKKSEFTTVTLDEAPQLFTPHKTGITYSAHGNEAVAVHLTEINKPYEPAFETIKETATNDWYEEQAWKAAHKDLNEAFKQAQTPFETLAQTFNVTYETTSSIDPTKESDIESLAKRGIEPNSLISLTEPGSLSQAEGPNNVYLIKLKEVNPLDETDFADKKSTISAALIREKRELIQRGFVASLLRNATLTYNESFTD